MENPSNNYQPTHEACQSILTVVPTELVPHDVSNRVSIFQDLDRILQKPPSLANLVGAVVREEGMAILHQGSALIEASALQRVNDALSLLPQISDVGLSKKLISRDEIFQLEHDLGGPMNFVFGHEEIMPPSYDVLYEIYKRFGNLRYRYASIKNNPVLESTYSTLIREFSKHEIIPAIKQALQDEVPFGNYELLEARSAFRELAQIDPLTFAVKFPLLTTIKNFIQDRQSFLKDKNTGKSVEVIISTSSTDPIVFMDSGDLIRMLRNLLRDAVTHGEEPIIKPIIETSLLEDGQVNLSIYSAGELEPRVLEVIGKRPYTTQDRGSTRHGYGKVGASKLLTDIWTALGIPAETVKKMLKEQWCNTFYNKIPHVRWSVPIPVA